MEAAEVTTHVKEGRVLPGMFVRDEASSGWTPVEQSPFGPMLPKPKPPEQTLGQKIFAVIFLVGGVFLFVKCAVGSDDDNNPPAQTAEEVAAAKEKKAEDELIGAWSMCQVFAKKQLKSPGTADFGGVFGGDYQRPRDTVEKLPGHQYKCTGWVDSQNSFGALVRTKFSITVKDNKDTEETWNLVDIGYFE